MTRMARFLLIILIIIGLATAIFWFKPDLLSSLSAFNPFASKEEGIPVVANVAPVSPVRDTPAAATAIPSDESGGGSNVDPNENNNDNNNDSQEPREKELTPFEKEIQQRLESYQTKVYTYEPYQPLVFRNPFQRIVNSVYVEEEEGEEEKEMVSKLTTEEDIRRFVQPELPPDSKFTGLISSGEEKLAILEIDNETYIVKEGDILLDKFLVKSIQEEKVIIEINGFEIPLKLGGGEATDD